jgi:hypothetical protein
MQNVNYAMYLLNVLVSESWVRPNVLLSKQQLRASNRHFLFCLCCLPYRKLSRGRMRNAKQTWKKYVWEGSQSQRTVEQLLQRMPDKEKAQDMPEVIELYAAYAGEYHITLTVLSFQTAFPLMVKINSFHFGYRFIVYVRVVAVRCGTLLQPMLVIDLSASNSIGRLVLVSCYRSCIIIL